MEGDSTSRPARAPLWRRGGRRGDFHARPARGTWAAQSKKSQEPSPTTSVDHTGALLASIHVDQQQTHLETAVEKEDLAIQDCQYRASYNWLDTKKPTILVPGSPPAYLPPKHAPQLKQDNGTYFRDPNAARFPQFPFEPAIRALLKVNPDFECAKLDIVGCGNTIGSLLSAARHEERNFYFGAERIGKTIFLIRQGTSPRAVIEGVYGYGHTFPEAYTSWDADVKGSASHQRLISYRFGKVHCLVRSEADGYFPDLEAHESKGGVSASLDGHGASGLQSATASLTVSGNVVGNAQKVLVRLAGRAVPQGAIFDLKTRSVRKDVDVAEFLPRLWVNQTPNLIIARHESGKFNDIQKKDVRAALKGWEQENSGVLQRLHALLLQLIEITGRAGCSRVQVSREGTGPVRVRKATRDWTALPAKLKTRWEGKAATRDRKDVNDATKNTNDTEDSEDTLSESDSEEEDDDDYLKF